MTKKKHDHQVMRVFGKATRVAKFGTTGVGGKRPTMRLDDLRYFVGLLEDWPGDAVIESDDRLHHLFAVRVTDDTYPTNVKGKLY